jgi:chromosome segregation ATPase
VDRVRLVFACRKLARLETALGLLGWQQADYDESTQAHVNQLMDCEREQARLTNESAALGLEIEELERQRGARQREHEEAVAEALRREQPAAKNEKQLAAEMATQRKQRREIEARLPVIDEELAAAEEQYRALVDRENFSREHEDDLLDLRRVILALPREKAEWQGKLALTEQRLRSMEELAGRLREARVGFEKDDASFGAEIAECQRAKRVLEKQVDTLEKAKSDPYREIGRTLADHKIAPLNQPDALAVVLEQRERIAHREAAVAASLEASAGEDRAAVRTFWLLAGGFGGVVLIAILAIAAQ